MSKQQVQLKEKELTAGQRQVLKWLDNDGVCIELINGRYYITKFGLTVRELKSKGFEAIKDRLSVENFGNGIRYRLTYRTLPVRTFTNG